MGLILGIGKDPFLFQAQTHLVSYIDASFCFKYVKAGWAFKHEYAQTSHLILNRTIRPMCISRLGPCKLTWVLIRVLTGIDPIQIQPFLIPTCSGGHDSESIGGNDLYNKKIQSGSTKALTWRNPELQSLGLIY